MITRVAFVAGTWVALTVGIRAVAQTTVSPVERVVTAAEDARGFRLYHQVGLLDSAGAKIPVEQLDSVVVARAKQWILSLRKGPATGIQLDPMGRLALETGQDALAQQQFDTRLATPRLSVGDRAYTLLLATTIFSQDVTHQARMRVATKYLAALDALPDEVAGAKYHAHITLAHRYYLVGDGTQVRMHSRAAFALIPALPFRRRDWFDIGEAFVRLANVLSGQPDGRSHIDSIGNWLKGYTQASPALLAEDHDSAYYWAGRANARIFSGTLQMTNYLGRPAPPIQAQYWWNTTAHVTESSEPSASPSGTPATTPVTQSKALNDGKIRMIEFGDYGCEWCQVALPLFDRMGQAAPSNVETWYVTYAEDMWGATRCTPDEAAAHLKHHYLELKQLKLKIALWIGPRVPDDDGGTLPEENPMFTALAIRAKPTFMLTDGNGIVRHISVAFSQDVLHAALQYLLREASSSAHGTTLSSTTLSSTTLPGEPVAAALRPASSISGL